MHYWNGNAFLRGNVAWYGEAAELLSYFTELLALYALFLFAKRKYSEDAAQLSVALFAVMPVCFNVGGTANNDFAVCLFSLLAVICFVEYLTDKRSERLYLIAAFGGFALTAKMTGFITLAWLFISIIYISLRDKFKIPKAAIMQSIVILLLFGSVVYVRNYTWTANPVFPFMSDIFKGNNADASSAAKKMDIEGKMSNDIKVNFLNYLELPYYLVAKQQRYQYQPGFFVISAIIVFLLRVFFVKKRVESLELHLLAFVVFYFTVWFFSGSQLWRYALAALPFAAFCCPLEHRA